MLIWVRLKRDAMLSEADDKGLGYINGVEWWKG